MQSAEISKRIREHHLNQGKKVEKKLALPGSNQETQLEWNDA